MTMQEKAIEQLERVSRHLATIGEKEDYTEIAIQALEQGPILDKIRADVIARYPKNYAGDPELGGSACEFSLNEILKILDKYKAEREREE